MTESFNKNSKKVTDLVFNLEEQVTARTRDLEYANEKLENLSFKDGLTGLFNRRKFDEVFSGAWDYAMRHTGQLGVLMLDIDYFKRYNDTYGHLEGDDCLRAIGNELRRQVRRSTDLVARYGGEEFGILLQEFERDNIEAFVERIRESIEALKIEHLGSEFKYVTVSIGVSSIIPTRKINPEELIRRADNALYKAKEKGRNRVYVNH